MSPLPNQVRWGPVFSPARLDPLFPGSPVVLGLRSLGFAEFSACLSLVFNPNPPAPFSKWSQKSKSWRFVMLSPSASLRTGSAKHLDSVPPKAGKRLPNGHIEILRFAQNDGGSHLSFLRPLVHGRLSPRRVPITETGPAR